MKRLAFAIILAALGLPVAANAQQPPPPAPGSFWSFCAEDAHNLCPGLSRPDQRKCLAGKLSQVSQSCGTAFANARSAAKDYQQACGADIKQYCGDQPPGPARHRCVVANTPKFSEACQTARAPTPAQ